MSCSVTHPNVVATYHYDITPIRSAAVVCSGGLQVADAQAASRAAMAAGGGVTDWKLYLVQVGGGPEDGQPLRKTTARQPHPPLRLLPCPERRAVPQAPITCYLTGPFSNTSFFASRRSFAMPARWPARWTGGCSTTPPPCPTWRSRCACWPTLRAAWRTFTHAPSCTATSTPPTSCCAPWEPQPEAPAAGLPAAPGAAAARGSCRARPPAARHWATARAAATAAARRRAAATPARRAAVRPGLTSCGQTWAWGWWPRWPTSGCAVSLRHCTDIPYISGRLLGWQHTCAKVAVAFCLPALRLAGLAACSLDARCEV